MFDLINTILMHPIILTIIALFVLGYALFIFIGIYSKVKESFMEFHAKNLSMRYGICISVIDHGCYEIESLDMIFESLNDLKFFLNNCDKPFYGKYVVLDIDYDIRKNTNVFKFFGSKKRERSQKFKENFYNIYKILEINDQEITVQNTYSLEEISLLKSKIKSIYTLEDMKIFYSLKNLMDEHKVPIRCLAIEDKYVYELPEYRNPLCNTFQNLYELSNYLSASRWQY